jgi:uncharacterized membrane protein YhaH (DUF805 family)
MYWYFEVIGKCANFSGRSGRKEYWMFVLYYFIFGLAIIILDRFIMDLTGRNFMVITLIYGITMLLPGIAVSIRRLHDIDKSGWMILILFIPLIGLIWLWILMMIKGNPGNNKFGPNQIE